MTKLKDGNFASGSYDNTARIWNLSTASVRLVLSANVNYSTSISVLADGNVVTGSMDGIWNTLDSNTSLLYNTIGHGQGGSYFLFGLNDGNVAFSAWYVKSIYM